MRQRLVRWRQNLASFGKTLVRSRMGVVGLTMLAVAIAAAVLAPWIAPYDPRASIRVSIEDIFARPSSAHWLGTDDGGKDVFSAFVYGSRVSLIVGFAASMISMLIGGTVGLVAGFYGGRIGNFLMRLTDIFLVIPDLPLMIVIVAIVGPSLWNIIFVIGILGWTGTARIVRAQALSLKERQFVTRARALGAGNFYILRRHIFPLVLPLMVANTVLVISLSILEESTLSFLGLGDPTTLSWGGMLNFAFTRGAISAGAWWALVAPGLGIVWVVLACTLVGNTLEEAFNPRLQSHHLQGEDKMVVRRGPAQAAEE
ncbi:MAG: ABC transporter permease [Anaerolineales bacterium]|nr:ABC transporter permease [Anaerolineales bacterium]